MPWVKGQSGNPGGRTKTAHAITVIARKNCREAIRVAVELLRDAEQEPLVRLRAAAMLLDRGIGKPAQCVTASHLTDEELLSELLARREARSIADPRTADRSALSS